MAFLARVFKRSDTSGSPSRASHVTVATSDAGLTPSPKALKNVLADFKKRRDLAGGQGESALGAVNEALLSSDSMVSSADSEKDIRDALVEERRQRLRERPVQCQYTHAHHFYHKGIWDTDPNNTYSQDTHPMFRTRSRKLSELGAAANEATPNTSAAKPDAGAGVQGVP